MRDTLLNCHKEWNYCPAIWHQRYYARDGRDIKIEGWLSRNGLDWIPWHDGRVWRRSIERNIFHHVVTALRECPLPLVFVGPEVIRQIVEKKFKVTEFIAIHHLHAYNHREKIVKAVLSFGEPAMISFSAGGTANILIHTLFPEIGDRSILVDFGASWEILAGKNRRVRPYAKALTPQRIRKNWEGKCSFYLDGSSRKSTPGYPIKPGRVSACSKSVPITVVPPPRFSTLIVSGA